MGPQDVITSVRRRRRWTPKQKKAMVEEKEQPGNSISSGTKKYEVHPNQLFKWRFQEGALQAVVSEEPLVPLSEVGSFRGRFENYSVS